MKLHKLIISVLWGTITVLLGVILLLLEGLLQRDLTYPVGFVIGFYLLGMIVLWGEK